MTKLLKILLSVLLLIGGSINPVLAEEVSPYYVPLNQHGTYCKGIGSYTMPDGTTNSISFEAIMFYSSSEWVIRNMSLTYGTVLSYYFPNDYGAEIAFEYNGIGYTTYVPLSGCEERYQ